MLTRKHFINLISISACALITLFFLIKASKELNISYLWGAVYNAAWLIVVVLMDASGKEKIRNFIPVFITGAVLLIHFVLILSGYSKEILWLTFDRNALFSSIVFLAVIYLTEKTSYIKSFYLFINSIFFGLMIYFNIDFILPLIIFGLYFYRENLIHILIFGALTAAVVYFIPQLFSAVFPKYQFHTIEIFSVNFWTIFLLSAAVYAGWIIADSQELFFSVGLFLFLPRFFATLFEGNNLALDSYVISLPFFLMAIRNYRVDKFLGKVYLVR